jgi:hypothetical protein
MLKARLQTPEVIETVNVFVTDLVELNEAKIHFEQQMDSEVANIIAPHQHSITIAQQNFVTDVRIFVASVFLITILVPLTVIPGLIIFVLPAGFYLVGKIYDDISAMRSTKDEVSRTMEWERTSEKTEQARLMVYRARLLD